MRSSDIACNGSPRRSHNSALLTRRASLSRSLVVTALQRPYWWDRKPLQVNVVPRTQAKISGRVDGVDGVDGVDKVDAN